MDIIRINKELKALRTPKRGQPRVHKYVKLGPHKNPDVFIAGHTYKPPEALLSLRLLASDSEASAIRLLADLEAEFRARLKPIGMAIITYRYGFWTYFFHEEKGLHIFTSILSYTAECEAGVYCMATAAEPLLLDRP